MKTLACVLVVGLLLPFLPTVVWSRPNWEETSKLCGRDLIRAFIYICGGSTQTRRMVRDAEDNINSRSDAMSMDIDRLLEERDNEIINYIDRSILHNVTSSNLDEVFALNHHIDGSGSIRNKRTEEWSFSKQCCAIGCNREDFLRICF